MRSSLEGATRRLVRITDALFLGRLPARAETHRHHVLQCSIALDGELQVRVDASRSLRLPSVLIAPDHPHAVSARGLVGHFYVAPESRAGRALLGLVSDAPVAAVEEHLPASARDALRRAWRDEARLEPCLDDLVGALRAAAPARAAARDSRVAEALRLLHAEDDALRLAELARRVGLSPDRLRHLFVRETGLTLRRYRSWTRLVRALDGLERGTNVTEAALHAGFADAAHLSRTFRGAFSFSPAIYLRDSRSVQAVRKRPR